MPDLMGNEKTKTIAHRKPDPASSRTVAIDGRLDEAGGQRQSAQLVFQPQPEQGKTPVYNTLMYVLLSGVLT